jgi:hypothetical protein
MTAPLGEQVAIIIDEVFRAGITFFLSVLLPAFAGRRWRTVEDGEPDEGQICE